MENQHATDIVPAQTEGNVINAQSIAKLSSVDAAHEVFEKAKCRLLDVNGWHELAGKPLAHFYLTDSVGNNIPGPVKEGNYFKIDIPGPGTEAGKGFDWVRVEKIERNNSGDTESVSVRVRPAANPKDNNPDTAHFYSHDSTSSFIIMREQTKVTALICDRNIKTNTDSGKITDFIRNTIIGSAGIISFSKIQWKSLTDGLIKE